jgi:hypothetical protein
MQMQPPEAKKKSKAPLIIGLSVGAAVIIAAILLTIFLFIPMLTKGAPGTAGLQSDTKNVYTATENLLFYTQAADMVIKTELDGQTADIGIKWDLGKDLKTSTIWVAVKGSGSFETGYLLKDDTFYVYTNAGSSGLSSYKADVEGGSFVDYLNEYTAEERGGGDVDYNKLVKDGRFDLDYFAQANLELSEFANEFSDGYSQDEYFGLSTILVDFMSTELEKEEARDKFMDNLEVNENGDEITYTSEVDLVGFIEALRDYADERSSDSDLADGADTLIEVCDEILDSAGSLSVNFDVSATINKGTLAALELSMSAGGEDIVISFEVANTDANGFSLDGDTTIEDIVDSAVSSGSSIF